jgi:t-SNARE complex subunit (syntaxin)
LAAAGSASRNVRAEHRKAVRALYVIFIFILIVVMGTVLQGV